MDLTSEAAKILQETFELWTQPYGADLSNVDEALGLEITAPGTVSNVPDAYDVNLAWMIDSIPLPDSASANVAATQPVEFYLSASNEFGEPQMFWEPDCIEVQAVLPAQYPIVKESVRRNVLLSVPLSTVDLGFQVSAIFDRRHVRARSPATRAN
nr:hypothetical protein B0A51_16185 [Rachicladosporium sp. CCFEE 5018]